MDKSEVEQSLNQSWERADTLRELRTIVKQIEDNVPGKNTKEMMYTLVDVVIQLSERVHDLEMRLTSYDVKESLDVREEKLRVDLKKRSTTNLYKQKRSNNTRHK